MLIDDVFSNFPLQSNGTPPARLTAGGIHGQNIFLTRAKFSSRRSVVRNGSGGVVCCVSNMAFQNGARIFSDEYLDAKFQFLSEVHYRKFLEVYYRKFFRSLLPKIFPKFTTENSSEVYHRKFFRSLQPKIPPKFTTENSSEVYYRKIQKHLEGCGKKDVGSNWYKVFTVNYIHDVYVINDLGARGKTILNGLCFRRQRKSEEPHKLSLKCESEDKGVANVVQKSCS